jgi:hypothetical protein
MAARGKKKLKPRGLPLTGPGDPRYKTKKVVPEAPKAQEIEEIESDDELHDLLRETLKKLEETP